MPGVGLLRDIGDCTMKKRWIFLFAFTLTIAGTVATLAQDDAEVRKELEAQYKKLAEAHDRKDLKTIASLKSSDFHVITPDDRVNDVKMMEQYTKQFIESNKPPFNIRNTIKKLSVSENKLVAVVEVFQEASRQRDLAGKLRKVDTSVLQRETWVKTADGWKLKSVDNVRDQKRFVDGKRVDPIKSYDPNAPPYNPNDTGAKKQ
jgi:ketosteroid isomerase-like protein